MRAGRGAAGRVCRRGHVLPTCLLNVCKECHCQSRNVAIPLIDPIPSLVDGTGGRGDGQRQ